MVGIEGVHIASPCICRRYVSFQQAATCSADLSNSTVHCNHHLVGVQLLMNCFLKDEAHVLWSNRLQLIHFEGTTAIINPSDGLVSPFQSLTSMKPMLLNLTLGRLRAGRTCHMASGAWTLQCTVPWEGKRPHRLLGSIG